MLYLAEIKVANKEVWGETFQRTINLPSKIGKIKSVCFFAELERNKTVKGWQSFFTPDKKIKSYTNNQGTITIEWNEFFSPMIGSCTLCVNGTNPIVAGSPLCAINMAQINGENERYDQTYQNNKVQLSEPVEIKGGSTLSIIVEEKDIAPNAFKSGYHTLSQNVVSNGYTVKIYIEYDR